jgi:hypothetical protein
MLANLRELSGIRLSSVTGTVRSLPHRLFSRGLAESRDENATRFQDRPRPLPGFSPDEVEDQINVTCDLVEPLGFVVDGPVGAESPDKVEVLG